MYSPTAFFERATNLAATATSRTRPPLTAKT
jgi:hypothetical protein